MILIHDADGRPLDLEALAPADVNPELIARGLSNACRFAGQLHAFYSVAQHAWLVSHLVDRPWAFPALHHDDSESLMGDMSRELKHNPAMAWYRALEATVQEVCEISVGITLVSADARKQIKIADDLAAIYERAWIRDRRPFSHRDIDQAVETGWVRRSTRKEMISLIHQLPETWEPWTSEQANVLFLTRHAALKQRTGVFV